MKRILFPIGALLVVFLTWLLWPREQPKGAPSPTKRESKEPKYSPPLRKIVYESSSIAQDKDPNGALTLEGQVVDEAGAAVVGATVWLNTSPPKTITTNEVGWFSFESLTGRPYQLSANKGDAFVGPVELQLNKDSGPVILTLRAGSSFLVKVVDASSQQPIAEAKVSLLSLESRTATTNRDGEATFAGLGPGRFTLRAEAKNFAPARREVFTLGTSIKQETTIALEPGAEVSGLVTDPSGRPIEGAVVAAEPASALLFHSLGYEQSTTDSSGRFSFATLGAGSYHLRATHPSFAPTSSPLLSLDGTTPRTDINITLQPGGKLKGKVVNSDGQGAPFALVRFVYGKNTSLRASRQLYCDESGVFTAEGLPLAEVALQASGDESTSEYYFVDLTENPSQEDIELVLDNAGEISGIVVNTKEEPMANVVVRVLNRKGVLELPKYTPSVLTDPDGRFTLRGFKDGTYTIQATAPGAPRQSIAEFLADDEKPWQKKVTTGDKNAKLVLQDNGTLKGAVQLPNGKAPERFDVIVDGNEFEATPFVGTNGAFSLNQIEPGEHDITFIGAFQDTEVEDIILAPGEERDLGVIKLQGGASLTGRVVTEDGRPVAGARVVAAESIGGGLYQLFGFDKDFEDGKETWSKADGSFTFEGLDAPKEDDFQKEYQLTATHPTLGRAPYVTVQKGESKPIELALSPFASLEGTITRGEEPVQALLSLKATKTNNVELLVTSEADGSYRFDRLAPVEYELSYGDSYRLSIVIVVTNDKEQEQKLTLAAGEAKKLELQFPRKPTILAQALSSGAPIDAKHFLVPGSSAPATEKEAYAREGYLDAGQDHWFAPPTELPPESVLFPSVPPGSYFYCARQRSSEEEDPKLTCKAVSITERPDVQKLTISITP